MLVASFRVCWITQYRGALLSEVAAVARFMSGFIQAPRIGEVYNLGGGRENSISIPEAFALISEISGKKMSYEYLDQHRKGDHICYISDLSKMRAHYPEWGITRDLRSTFEEIFRAWRTRPKEGSSPRSNPGVCRSHHWLPKFPGILWDRRVKFC
jgi:nucleoside-diphosphate-sugar epimerase